MRMRVLFVGSKDPLVVCWKMLFQDVPAEVEFVRTMKEAESCLCARRYDAVITSLPLRSVKSSLRVMALTHATQEPSCNIAFITASQGKDFWKRFEAVYQVTVFIHPLGLSTVQQWLGLTNE